MHYIISSAICFNLHQSKILSSGNELSSLFLEYYSHIFVIIYPLPEDNV